MIWILLLMYQSTWAQATQDVYHEPSQSWFNVAFNHSDAYFGYSITYEPTSKRLIVSAPQGDNIGEIYSCELTTGKNTCASLPKDTRRYFDTKYDHTYWFGATVKAGPSYFVTCAPLNTLHQTFNIYVDGFNNKTKPRTAVGTFSRCYKYTELSKKPDYSNLKPLSVNDRTSHATLFEHAMDSFGWSIDVDGDDIIIGGPAMFTGRVIKYDNKPNNPTTITGLLDESKINERRRVDYNFGYSVVVGYFTSGKNTKSYAVGSPYGKMGFGKVSFYEFVGDKAYLNQIPSLKSKSKESLQTDDEFAVGSMFGAVLCAARLTRGSTATTLLVGAPTYATHQRYNQGAVYFYAPAANLPLKNHYIKIVGKNDGGFFGSAIARLGDYNGDGLDEIAIAAPYEYASAGGVYIYSSLDTNTGSPSAVIAPMQRIAPSPSAGIVQSFGLSLTAVQDYDENGCNELAIGAPESNRVMLLKCIASVTVKLRADIPKDLTLRKDNPYRNEDHFIFQSCFDVESPEKPKDIYAHINVSVELDHHPTVKLMTPADKTYEVILIRTDKPLCKSIKVSAPKNGYYQIPIGFKINANQLTQEFSTSEFNASHVMLSDRSILSTSGSIWLIECNDVNHCKPDVKLTKSISVTPARPYVLGSPEKVNLAMSVKNDGEAAYAACLRVYTTPGVVVAGLRHATAGVPEGCERADGRVDALICKPPGALRKADLPWPEDEEETLIVMGHNPMLSRRLGDRRMLTTVNRENAAGHLPMVLGAVLGHIQEIPEIPFDLSQLTSDWKSASISIAVYNDCDQDPEWQNVSIPLKADFSKISIKGIIDAGVSNSVNMSKDDVDGKWFEHIYTVTNGGLTNWVNVEVTVIRESRPYIEYNPIYISSDNSESSQCLARAGNDSIYTCVVRELNSKQPAKITVPMMIINPEELETAINEKQNTQFTSLTLKLTDEETRTASLTSTLNLGGQVKIWIVVVASLVALLMLLVLFLALSRCGFFKREKKTVLKNARESVRRQTVVRRTMVEGMRLPPGADRESLLASVSHETADQAAARDKRVRLDSNATKKKLTN